MTQVPGPSQSPLAGPVSSVPASTPDSPREERTAPGTGLHPAILEAFARAAGTTPEDLTVERTEYAHLWNAVADALIAFCLENDYPRPRFSARNRVASNVWRELHPDSAFGGLADGNPS